MQAVALPLQQCVCLLPECKNYFTHAARHHTCYINTLARLRGGEEIGATDWEDIVASVATRRRIIPSVIRMTGLHKRLAEASRWDIQGSDDDIFVLFSTTLLSFLLQF